jgi:hypothetical protein
MPDRSLGTELDAGLLYAMTHVIPKIRFKSQGCASDRAMLATSDAAGASRSNVARLGPTAPALFGRLTALRTYVRAGLPLHDHRARPGTAVAVRGASKHTITLPDDANFFGWARENWTSPALERRARPVAARAEVVRERDAGRRMT